MASVKDKLKKSKKSSPVTQAVALVPKVEVVQSELQEITERIINNVSQIERLRNKAVELKQKIADDILYLAQNKNRLLPDRNLIDYIENDLGISKSYFYQIKKGYEFLIEHNQPELITDVDYRIIADISRVKDENLQNELLANAKDLTREKIKEEVKKCAGHTFKKGKDNSVMDIEDHVQEIKFLVKEKTTPQDRKRAMSELFNIFRLIMGNSSSSEQNKFINLMKKEIDSWD